MTKHNIDQLTNFQRFKIQEYQYSFPYHYIPYLYGSFGARVCRSLKWGFEYLCYQHHIVDKVLTLKPTSLLEVGCGDGYFLGAIGTRIDERMGADFSEHAIRFAKAFNPDVSFHTGDAKAITRQFDVVVAIEVLEHIPDENVTDFLYTLFGLARPGGHIVISVPSVALRLNDKHFRHYTENLLKSQVFGACSSVEVQSIEHICKIPWWLDLYTKLLSNRYGTIEINALSDIAWQHMWNKHRFACARTGRHIVGCFKKFT